MINDSQIRAYGWASEDEHTRMMALTFRVNEVLKYLFVDAGSLLVVYKLEFGRFHGEVVLGYEFSPDGCRLWDATTREKLDKDRFRQDLGNVIEAYEEVARRLGVDLTCSFARADTAGNDKIAAFSRSEPGEHYALSARPRRIVPFPPRKADCRRAE